MNNFKRIMMSGHTQRKEYLQKLYADRQIYISSLSSSMQPVAEEKIFYYKDLSFNFEGTGYRSIEKMIIYVFVPPQLIGCNADVSEIEKSLITAYEDFILRTVSAPVNELSMEYKNDKKSSREQPDFSVQRVNQTVLKRNGCIYMEEKNAFRIRIHFNAPLINDKNLNGKSSFKAVRNILELIYNKLAASDKEKLAEHINLYSNQMKIRKYLKDNKLMAFIANGSILPRDGETDYPMAGALPFVSPRELSVDIELSPSVTVSGMALKKGITIITGGGYSGKSTILDSLETGIYNHIQGDGREYVITEESACKICAEDGRYINNTDISPFFTHIPGNKSVHCFKTAKASGSVSQAAAITEAAYGGCKLLLIDEDTSATNFMIRDNYMHMLVEKEPIIPFTERIIELKSLGISTILVIGGFGEYLRYADNVILMEDYAVHDRTEYVKRHILPLFRDNDNLFKNIAGDSLRHKGDYRFMTTKKADFEKPANDFFYAKFVKIENARYIKINDYMTDITKITAVISDEQINSLTYLIEALLAKCDNDTELSVLCNELTGSLFEKSIDKILSGFEKYELWLEEVRGIDLLMAVCRMREMKES